MNYTGRPSISGCRPVLSLYPTHHFCQYLLRIFITFTNSSLFCRAFSTNSRKPSQSRRRRDSSPRGGGAQPLRHCFAMPPPLPRGGLGIAENFSSSPEAPLLGATATTAASGGNREELLGPRPAGCEQQRSRRWEPQPGLGERSRLRGCTKESLSSVGKSGSWHLLYLFGETCGIMGLRPCPPIYSGGEVRKMESILSFILSVGANVAAYYICKWLDGWFMGRKH